MKKVVGLWVGVLLILLVTVNVANAEDYRLGPGDVLSISIWGFEDILANSHVARLDGVANGFVVRPDGKLSFPLIGEITAAGLTTSQFTSNITQALREYLNDPKTTVNIVKFRTTRVYVLGEVNKPGMYELDKLHNVLDAIGIAGGYNKYAAKRSIFLIHGAQPDQPIKIDLLKMLKTGDMSQNYALAEGDVVYLTSNGKLDFNLDIAPVISSLWYVRDLNKK